jgi:hypothetical protein
VTISREGSESLRGLEYPAKWWLEDEPSDDFPEEPEGPTRRDPKTEEAKETLDEFFRRDPPQVYYQRQLQVIFERDYFHWVTVRALRELVEERRIETASYGRVRALGGEDVRFYWPRRLRYWKREVDRLLKVIVNDLSHPVFTRALGNHGETMFDAALGRIGFARFAKDVGIWNEKEWRKSGHNLDRVYGRDGVFYGAEIKNSLAYIPEDELSVKLEMCELFEIRPLFIMRFAPKIYIHQIWRAGGYAWIFEDQLYPFGMEDKAKKIREALGLKVHAPTEVPDGMVRRFEKWHRRLLEV